VERSGTRGTLCKIRLPEGAAEIQSVDRKNGHKTMAWKASWKRRPSRGQQGRNTFLNKFGYTLVILPLAVTIGCQNRTDNPYLDWYDSVPQATCWSVEMQSMVEREVHSYLSEQGWRDAVLNVALIEPCSWMVYAIEYESQHRLLLGVNSEGTVEFSWDTLKDIESKTLPFEDRVMRGIANVLELDVRSDDTTESMKQPWCLSSTLSGDFSSSESDSLYLLMECLPGGTAGAYTMFRIGPNGEIDQTMGGF